MFFKLYYLSRHNLNINLRVMNLMYIVALRYINPSPYIFYFDYSSYKLFGFFTELQFIIKDKKEYVSPIKGTIKK